MADEDLWMRAYYFEFSPTGVRPVDEILSAVARAGKAYHHTEYWADSNNGEPSYAEEIESAAVRAAQHVRGLAAAERSRIRRELRDAIGANTVNAFRGTDPAHAQPALMVGACDFLTALDRICPEAPGEPEQPSFTVRGTRWHWTPAEVNDLLEELATALDLEPESYDLLGNLILDKVAALKRDSARLMETLIPLSPWQPIETAPKDGTEVLLTVDYRAGIRGKCLVGHYMAGGFCIEDHPAIDAGWYFWDGHMFNRASRPTHWMPLPAGPGTDPCARVEGIVLDEAQLSPLRKPGRCITTPAPADSTHEIPGVGPVTVPDDAEPVLVYGETREDGVCFTGRVRCPQCGGERPFLEPTCPTCGRV